MNPRTDEVLVNAFQKQAAAVLQLSQREGFGLIVSEALRKQALELATTVGDIPLQFWEGQAGFLVKPGGNALVADRGSVFSGIAMCRQRPAPTRQILGPRRVLMSRFLLDWLRLAGEPV